MIVIDIKNAEEVAKQQTGWFKLFLGKTLRVDIVRKVQEEIAQQLRVELAKQGVKADISVK